MGRYEELKKELTATVFYGKQIGDKLQNPDLGASERADLEAEHEAVLTKAEGIQQEAQRQQKDDERNLRIRSIGRDMELVSEVEEVVAPTYSDPIEAFFKSEQFETFRKEVQAGKRDAKVDPIEFKAAVNPVSADAGALVQQMAPGVADLNYRFPFDVGDLFNQGTMNGSAITYLKVPTGATGAAAYQTSYGAQKGGTFAMTLDTATESAKTIAAVATIPSQNLDDVNGLEGEVRALLLQGPNGLGEIREDAYLNGTGGSGAIQGILPLSPTATTSGSYLSKSVFKAGADIKAATGFDADGVVVSPHDWYLLSTEVGTVDNRPLFGAWGANWGNNGVGPRIVVSRKIASGTVLVGAFKADTRYIRSGVTISADASGLGLRDKNLVLFVAEVRELVLHRYGKDPYRVVTASS